MKQAITNSDFEQAQKEQELAKAKLKNWKVRGNTGGRVLTPWVLIAFAFWGGAVLFAFHIIPVPHTVYLSAAIGFTITACIATIYPVALLAVLFLTGSVSMCNKVYLFGKTIAPKKKITAMRAQFVEQYFSDLPEKEPEQPLDIEETELK